MPDKSQDAPHDAYFEDLLVRYLDNQLSPGELAEFQAMLTADSARCEKLAQWAHQAMLIQESPQECLMEFMDVYKMLTGSNHCIQDLGIHD